MDKAPETPHEPQPPLAPPSIPPMQPVAVPPQPPIPPQQGHQDHTDTMGIISIILPFVGFSLVGLILGLVGASKAKREGRPATLSRIGWIISLIVTILSILLLTLFILAAIAANSSINAKARQVAEQSKMRENDEGRVTVDGFSLVVPSSFTNLPDEYKSEDASFTQGDGYSEEYVAVIKEARADFSNSMDIQGYADLINNNNYKDGSVITSASVLPLSGVANPRDYQTADYQVTGVSSGVKIVYYIRYVATADYFYQVVTWTLPSKASQTKADLFNIIESFREE